MLKPSINFTNFAFEIHPEPYHFSPPLPLWSRQATLFFLGISLLASNSALLSPISQPAAKWLSSNLKYILSLLCWEPSKVLNVPRGPYKNCRPLPPSIAIAVTSFPTTVSLSSSAPAAVALFSLPATQTLHQGLCTCSSFKLKCSSLSSVRFLIKLPNSTFSERPFLTTLCTKIRPDSTTVSPLTLLFFLP